MKFILLLINYKPEMKNLGGNHKFESTKVRINISSNDKSEKRSKLEQMVEIAYDRNHIYGWK